VRCSSLLSSYAAVNARHDVGFAVFADLVSLLFWYMGFGCHGNLPCHNYVSLCLCRVFIDSLGCQVEQGSDSLRSDAFGVLFHCCYLPLCFIVRDVCNEVFDRSESSLKSLPPPLLIDPTWYVFFESVPISLS
jgi:hypothetical protein